ncbi:MAG: nuclear transport factor 2 family protein [Thermoleophilaceae bacterium]|nr:nuclear transport factor 2 family protein [Thermoleophilaceae bacterium]
MSQENVDLIERVVEAFDRHDLTTLQQLCDEDFEFVSVLAVVDEADATYRGPNAWKDYFRVIEEMWSEWHTRDIEIFDTGGDQLACLFRLVGTGKLSGVPVERALGITYRIRDGRLWRMRSYPNPADALEAVGLSE